MSLRLRLACWRFGIENIQRAVLADAGMKTLKSKGWHIEIEDTSKIENF